MPYIERIVKAGDVREHKKMFTTQVHTPGAKRAPKQGRTSAAMERVNARRAEDQLRWVLNANFTAGDFHIVLHYRGKNITMEQAERDRAAFLRLARKAYRKRGIPWKYVACTENKHMTNIHHHIIIAKSDMKLLQDVWEDVLGERLGRVSFAPLDKRGNHAKLAHYLMKETAATMRRMREAGRRWKRFSTSKGLVHPKPTYRVIPARSWADDPRPHKGYQLIKNEDGSTSRSGVNDVTGWPWMEYFEIRDGAD